MLRALAERKSLHLQKLHRCQAAGKPAIDVLCNEDRLGISEFAEKVITPAFEQISDLVQLQTFSPSCTGFEHLKPLRL